MTNEEILKKAVDKAVDNGWSEGWSVLNIWKHADEKTRYYWINSQLENEEGEPRFGYKGLIFSHNFAKAFWGDDHLGMIWDGSEASSSPLWQYHLQQMVLSEDPIKYLEQFL